MKGTKYLSDNGTVDDDDDDGDLDDNAVDAGA